MASSTRPHLTQNPDPPILNRVTEVLLGIDVGTGSTKGVLATPDGTIVARTARNHRLSLPRPGWAEMDAEAIWWGDLVAISRELADAAARSGHHIAGACISGLGPCVLPTDADGRPLRAAIMYGIDMRAGAEIEELTERYGRDEIFRRCGKVLSSQAVGPKLTWIEHHEPEVWTKTRKFFNSNAWLAFRLTGEYVADHQTASQSDPLYDITARDWNHDWAADLAPELQLPRLVWPTEVIGTVTEQASATTGLPVGTPVSAGTIDAWSEAFGAGVRRPGDLMLMYGSTMFFVDVLVDYAAHDMLWTTNGVDRDQYTLAAGMATSGSLTQWLAELTGDADFSTLVDEARDVPPGSDGLLMLPYFAGERTPIFDPRARGVVAGLSLRHRRGHLFRAAYEGIAYGIRQILGFLSEVEQGHATHQRPVAVGGGTQGGLWTQIVSDVTGLPQDVPAETIGAAYGDALMAAIGTGLVPADTDWARVEQTIQPNPDTREVYQELFDTYGRLYTSTRDDVHRLAELQERSAD